MIIAGIRLGVLTVSFILCMFGYMSPQVHSSGTDLYLSVASDYYTVVRYSDLGCGKLTRNMNTARALVVICLLCIGSAAFCVCLVALKLLPQKGIVVRVSAALSLAACFCALLSWAVVVGTLNAELCVRGSSISSAGGELAVGSDLVIVTSIILMIDVAISVLTFIARARRINAKNDL